jgi:hypothetical protein
MALHEGCRRLRTAGKILMFFAVVVGLLGTAVVCFSYTFKSFEAAPLVPLLVPIVFFPGVMGVALWFLGWIVEGFASPQSTESDRPR